MHRFLICALLFTLTACGTTGGITFEIYAAALQDFPSAVSRIDKDSKVIYTERSPAITLDDIASAEVQKEPYLGLGHSLLLRMTPGGARKLEAFSQKQLDSPSAVVVDGNVILTPIFRMVVSDQVMITPFDLNAENRRLVERMNRRPN